MKKIQDRGDWVIPVKVGELLKQVQLAGPHEGLHRTDSLQAYQPCNAVQISFREASFRGACGGGSATEADRLGARGLVGDACGFWPCALRVGNPDGWPVEWAVSAGIASAMGT